MNKQLIHNGRVIDYSQYDVHIDPSFDIDNFKFKVNPGKTESIDMDDTWYDKGFTKPGFSQFSINGIKFKLSWVLDKDENDTLVSFIPSWVKVNNSNFALLNEDNFPDHLVTRVPAIYSSVMGSFIPDMKKFASELTDIIRNRPELLNGYFVEYLSYM